MQYDSSGFPGRVLVTGGASGLGAAIAAAVRDAGGTAIVLDRDAGDGEHEYRVDVSDSAAVHEVVSRAIEEHGGLDAVVTAAGIDTPGRLDATPAEVWEKIVGVNLFGTVSVIRSALPALIASRGAVVTIASSLGIKAVGEATAYCASKFGVVGFTRSLAAETRGEVKVTTVIPAGMKTSFFEGREERFKPQDDSRLMDPSDVAKAILFAIGQPEGTAVRELVICHELEDSWP